MYCKIDGRRVVAGGVMRSLYLLNQRIAMDVGAFHRTGQRADLLGIEAFY